MFFVKSSAALCGFAAAASAHMLLAQPKPYSGSINSPISATDNSVAFPCQGKGGTAGATSMALGSTQPLAFTGQATHGGGSCQVSITYDTNPTKSSVWKVLHSIQGGCPATGQAGNMGGDASAADPYTFSFSIPDNIPAGQATIAWTWLNRIGNREFYMNCAPVTLTGTGGAKSNYDALPDMYVANLPSINTCTTQENYDYQYPNPGASVENHPFSDSSLKLLDGTCAGGSSGSSSGSGSGSSSPPAASSAPSTTASVPGGVFITVGSGGAASSTPAAVAPAASAAPTSSGSSSGSSSSGSSSSGSSSSGSSSSGSSGSSGSSSSSSTTSTAGAQTVGAACSPEGTWNCLGTQYQQCGSGIWTPLMPVAPGTTCKPGMGSSYQVLVASKYRRHSMRFRSA